MNKSFLIAVKKVLTPQVMGKVVMGKVMGKVMGRLLGGRGQTSGFGGGGRERPERTGAATGGALDLAAGRGRIWSRREMRV